MGTTPCNQITMTLCDRTNYDVYSNRAMTLLVFEAICSSWPKPAACSSVVGQVIKDKRFGQVSAFSAFYRLRSAINKRKSFSTTKPNSALFLASA